ASARSPAMTTQPLVPALSVMFFRSRRSTSLRVSQPLWSASERHLNRSGSQPVFGARPLMVSSSSIASAVPGVELPARPTSELSSSPPSLLSSLSSAVASASSSEPEFRFSCGVGSSSVDHAESSDVAFASPASAHPATRAMVSRLMSARRTREDRRAETRLEAGSEEEDEDIGIPSWYSEPGGRWNRNVVVDRVRPRCRCPLHFGDHIPPPPRRNRRRGQSDRFVTGPIRSWSSPRRRGMMEGDDEQPRRGGRTMRHDEERPRTSGFLSGGTMPGHWTQVLAEMRTNAFTHL